ncbi:MAG: hypothetical protein Kow0074_19020 [Candidatus Zixiibacteriota bacterium]
MNHMQKALASTVVSIVMALAASGLGAFSQSAAVVSYTFEYRAGSTPAVQVVLAVGGELDGSSRFVIAEEWGGITDCWRFVHDLTVRDSNGKRCELIVAKDTPNVWTVLHEPGSDLILTYELRPSKLDPLMDQATKYEPVVSDSLFHLIGDVGLVYPEWLENDGEVEIAFEWSGFAERGWTVASSHDARGKHFRTDLHGFHHAVFMAGRLQSVDRPIPGGTLRVAVAGGPWEFTAEQLGDLTAEIVSIEREFFSDRSEPFFTVTLVPAGPPVNAESISMGGTGLTNSFALFLAPGTMLADSSLHRRHVMHLLAHEYFHTWNGGAGAIALEEPEELTYWFSEGFTDFYASRLLRRAGLMSDDEWVDRLNGTIATLWRSPVAAAPATVIEQEYWTNRHVRDLPYDRGELVALMLDEQIRHRWDNAKSLDDFMRDVLADARRGQKASTENLLSRVAQWTGLEFAEHLRQIVVDGALPVPPAELTEPKAQLTHIPIYEFNPGFDIDGSIATGTVTGVRADGPAYRTGLRDGQTLEGYSVHYNEPDKEIMLTIEDSGDRQQIRFLPRGDSLLVPYYQLN